METKTTTDSSVMDNPVRHVWKSRLRWVLILFWVLFCWNVFRAIAKEHGIMVHGGLPILIYLLLYMVLMPRWVKAAFADNRPLSVRIATSLAHASLCVLVTNGLAFLVLVYARQSAFGMLPVLTAACMAQIAVLGLVLPMIHAGFTHGWQRVRELILHRTASSSKAQPSVDPSTTTVAQELSVSSHEPTASISDNSTQHRWPMLLLVGTVILCVAVFFYVVFSEQAPQEKRYPPWRQVAASPEYQKLSFPEKEKVREQYFREHIAPKVPPNEREVVWQEFYQATIPAVNIDLPEPAQAVPDLNPVTVSIIANGNIYVEKTPVTLITLRDEIVKSTNGNKNRRIYIRGDRNVNYGRIMQAVGEINAVGFSKVSFLKSIASP